MKVIKYFKMFVLIKNKIYIYTVNKKYEFFLFRCNSEKIWEYLFDVLG